MVNEQLRDELRRVTEVLENYRIFFVLGAPKSGTTWLQRALNAHPEIVCVGEGHFADKFSKALAPVIKDYFIHQRVVAKNVYEGDAGYRHNPQESFDFLVRTFVLHSFSCLDLPAGTRLIGDKTPANVEYLTTLHRLFPAAKFVNIIRDGRDTLVSTFKHAERVLRSNGKSDDPAGFLLSKTEAYTSRWVRSLQDADRFSEAHSNVLHSLRYEDLKERFTETLSAAVRFLGVDAMDADIERCRQESSFEKMTGGRQPGEEDPNAFVRKGVVGDWRSSLNEQHLQIFNATGGEWLKRYGYE